VELEVDGAACMGHGRCYAYAPELFDADDDGHAVLLMADVLTAYEGNARVAAEACPERAINLYE
jgi:ferredoxin